MVSKIKNKPLCDRMTAKRGILFIKPFADWKFYIEIRSNTTKVSFMRMSRNRYRMLYSALVVAAFFVPAYGGVSAFHFLELAISSVQTDPEITFVDVFVILLPLVFVLISALLIFYRASRQQHLSGLVLSLPLFFLLFFCLILSFDMNRQLDNASTLGLVKEINVGFYVASVASVLLLFSYNKREAMNLETNPE